MNNSRLRRAAVLALLALTVGVASLFKPVRTWASTEGSYLYSLLVMRGPIYIFAPRTVGAQGLKISTNTYAGASSTGVPSLPAGDVPLWFIGGQSTAARTACAAAVEGQFYYDTTVHSIAFCDATGWHKLVTGSAANDYWTTF